MKMPKGIRIVIDGVEEKDASILVKLLQEKISRWEKAFSRQNPEKNKDTLRVLISAAEGKLAELTGDER